MPAEREAFEPPHYINTDLDIVSSQDLTPLIEAFPADLRLLGEGPFYGLRHARFERARFGFHEPNACIYEMCRIVRALPRLRVPTLKAMTAVNGRFGITLYAPSLTLVGD